MVGNDIAKSQGLLRFWVHHMVWFWVKSAVGVFRGSFFMVLVIPQLGTGGRFKWIIISFREGSVTRYHGYPFSSRLLVETRVRNHEWVRARFVSRAEGVRNLYVKDISWRVQNLSYVYALKDGTILRMKGK